jgi:hypothetical protein
MLLSHVLPLLPTQNIQQMFAGSTPVTSEPPWRAVRRLWADLTVTEVTPRLRVAN